MSRLDFDLYKKKLTMTTIYAVKIKAAVSLFQRITSQTGCCADMSLIRRDKIIMVIYF